MSARIDHFHKDIRETISLCNQYHWPFTEFILQGNTLTFTFLHDHRKTTTFSLIVSEDDYPRNSILTASTDKDKINPVHEPVPNLLLKLRDEFLNKQDNTDNEGSNTVCDRQTSSESGNSDYKDCVSDDEEEYCIIQDEFDDELEDDEDDEKQMINPQLTEDLENVKLICGDNAVSCRFFESIGEIDVELKISLTFLSHEVAQAWDLDLEKPLLVRLHLSSKNYLDQKDPPAIKVLQPSEKEKFGIGTQIEKILETFLRDNWKNLSNKKQEAASKVFSVPADLTSFLKTPTRGDDKDRVTPVVDDEKLVLLMDMGFSSEISRNALIITKGNMEEAVNLVLTNPESCFDLNMETQIPDIKTAQPVARQLSERTPKHKHRQNKPGYGRNKSMTTPYHTEVHQMDTLSLMSTALQGKNAKVAPSLENGFLVQFFQYTRQRIPTLNEYCVVCDEPHMFQNCAMLKPSVCSRELCVFAFQALGVMVDAADYIATGSEVAVLLLKMTKAAIRSSRNHTIFDPYPSVVDPHNSKVLALNPMKKNYGEVQRILDTFPSVQEMMQMPSSEMKKELDRRHHLAYPLLQWIISSNRSHIVKLPTLKQIRCMKTPHQFLLLSSPPAKENIFQQERKKHGSTFAFHGSSIENWHSIIRQGLIVASGTSKQMNGAAHGKGIYLSPSISVSAGYSRMMQGAYPKSCTAQSSSRFVVSDNITCIALCEVITSPSLKKHNEIWVCPNDNHVCTRFFFVYEDGQMADNGINTQVDKYKTEIMNAISFQKH